MAAIDFPDSPSVGESFTANNKTWVYDGVSWKSLGATGVSVSFNGVHTDENAPSNPADGALWLDTTSNILYVYYDDGISPTWVTVGSGGGVSSITLTDNTSSETTIYPTLASNTAGSLTSTAVSSSKLYFQPSTGTLSATELNTLSDMSLKTSVESIENALTTIKYIRPVSYIWKDTDHVGYGVIAQEIENILPSIVRENDEGIKSVSYTQLIPFLIKAIQEQQKQINELKNK